MRLTLNLASHPYVELRPLYQRMRVLALLLLVTGALFWWLLRGEQQKASAAKARAGAMETAITQSRTERQQAESSMRQPGNAAVLTQAHFLNNLFLHKSFSWTAVMMDLEQVLPAGVQVLNIDPIVGKDGTVTIHMRVDGPRDKAVSLVRNLERSRRFRAPRVVGETAQSQNENGRPNPNFQPINAGNVVNFEVLAEYNPLEDPAKETAAAATGATRTGVAQTGTPHRTHHARKPKAGQAAAPQTYTPPPAAPRRQP